MTSYTNYIVYFLCNKRVVRRESDVCTLKDLLAPDELELFLSGECEFLLDNEPLSIDDTILGRHIRCVLSKR